MNITRVTNAVRELPYQRQKQKLLFDKLVTEYLIFLVLALCFYNEKNGHITKRRVAYKY